MEKVIIINEECHGFIGVAHNVPSIIDFLVENGWLQKGTEIFIANKGWTAVQTEFGSNWKEHFKSLSFDDLQDLFDGCFYFQEEEVW